MTNRCAAVEDYLASQGAGTRRHSGRDLITHLRGTHDILQRWQADEATCLAGLCHSVYDTKTYHARLAIERDGLRAVIGCDAEALAWRFRVIHLYERAALRKRPLIARLNARAQALFLIGAANLVEQAAYMSTRKLGSAPGRYRTILSRFSGSFPVTAETAMRAELPTP